VQQGITVGTNAWVAYKRRGIQRGTFLDTLKKDAGLESIEELRMCMEDRGNWMI